MKSTLLGGFSALGEIKIVCALQGKVHLSAKKRRNPLLEPICLFSNLF